MSAEKTCSVCEAGMYWGYVIDGGHEYICSEPCLKKRFTEVEIEQLGLGDDDSGSYWTEWDDEIE